MKYNLHDFFKWVKGTKLVELDDIDVSEDPVRPELTLGWRISQGRKIYGLKFEEIDEKTSYDDNSIMFIGSSSIRLWDKLEDVMDPLKIIKRGYGGAHYRDLIFYIDRILNNHSLSMIVCFVANDIKGLEDIYNIGGERDGSTVEIINL